MKKELAKTIGTAARQARKALQLTQADTAERIDVSVEFYARIERGTSLPSILTFARIVSSLGVSADLLLGRPATVLGAPWTPPAPSDGPEIRRLVRRLRKARPSALRLVNTLLKELEHPAASNGQSIADTANDNRDIDPDIETSARPAIAAI